MKETIGIVIMKDLRPCSVVLEKLNLPEDFIKAYLKRIRNLNEPSFDKPVPSNKLESSDQRIPGLTSFSPSNEDISLVISSSISFGDKDPNMSLKNMDDSIMEVVVQSEGKDAKETQIQEPRNLLELIKIFEESQLLEDFISRLDFKADAKKIRDLAMLLMHFQGRGLPCAVVMTLTNEEFNTKKILMDDSYLLNVVNIYKAPGNKTTKIHIRGTAAKWILYLYYEHVQKTWPRSKDVHNFFRTIKGDPIKNFSNPMLLFQSLLTQFEIVNKRTIQKAIDAFMSLDEDI